LLSCFIIEFRKRVHNEKHQQETSNGMQEDILFRFFAGEASSDEGMKIKKWVESSEDNLREFNARRKIFDMMNFVEEERNVQEASHTPSRRIRTRRWIEIAAAVMLTFIATHVYHYYTTHPDTAPTLCSIHTPAGQRTRIQLPDGTTVWLNACSTLQYPSFFTSENRRVNLYGEAYFEVAHRDKKPFIVETSRCNIEVLGTHFNVEAYPNTPKFETCLMEGSVKVSSKHNSQDFVVLKPHEKAALEQGRLRVSTVTDYNDYLWKEGIISFKNQSFNAVMHSFEKYFGTKIVITNKHVSKFFYTGKFRQTDGIDYALRVLQNDIDFTFRYDTEQQIITIE